MKEHLTRATSQDRICPKHHRRVTLDPHSNCKHEFELKNTGDEIFLHLKNKGINIQTEKFCIDIPSEENISAEICVKVNQSGKLK